MYVADTTHLFRNIGFTKTAAEIKEKMVERAEALRAKIADRQNRIAALRKEYEIDDGALVQLLTAARKQSHAALQFSYTSNVKGGGGGKMEERTIGAGVVNNLLTESDFIEAERDEADRLDLISRNVKTIPRFTATGVETPDTGFTMSEEDLRYLGF